ncbi:dihydropteroate synthase [Parvularcula maris]|uniref:Dihydropteroate synthase n=1 Tax=Parvularcula maris TaxID=2965077 RepID=A0A9X2RKA9_9PROT|nr:dihydropteroate synthase [Parvularcula maris]MCQ8185432.1 dihydropteroate synthase [Parvularcula maris]
MKIMGIVNVTPDSFSDGGRYLAVDAAVEHALKLETEGADILDIGGESTRPGAGKVPADEELLRVLPVIEALAKRSRTPLSIDTRKPEVAEAAVAAGATIWNDVSALTHSPRSLETAARLGCQVVLMHMQGLPETMQQNPCYGDVISEVIRYLSSRIDACIEVGIAKSRLIADPGIGFGKTLEHNLALFRGLERFGELGVPLLMGASRKRFIEAIAGPGERLGGSVAAALRAQQAGWDWVRVHDVQATRQALRVADAIAPPRSSNG